MGIQHENRKIFIYGLTGAKKQVLLWANSAGVFRDQKSSDIIELSQSFIEFWGVPSILMHVHTSTHA